MSCVPSKSDSNPLAHQIQNNVLTTLLVVIVFTAIKSYYDKIRRQKARVAVFVIGTGPVGVTAALAAVQTKRVTQLVFYEQEERNQVYDRNYQICFDRRSTNILKKLHVDFDNIEGIWDDQCFYTRVGNYIEYIFSAIKRSNTETKIYFNKKLPFPPAMKHQDQAMYQYHQLMMLLTRIDYKYYIVKCSVKSN